MLDAEERLRLAAESLNREALQIDSEAFIQQMRDRLGITATSEGCAGDSSVRVGRPPQAGPERGGRRSDSDRCPGHDEFFNLELQELVNTPILHTQPRVLRRIAELTELLSQGNEEAREWWIRAADAGDRLAQMIVTEWTGTTPDGPGRRQAHGD
ncbi:hypothetical protein [Streptomyces geranii]|uniref:hypothetical protein n=1 Tax=Streptomyces geranii TaxID=2058923 RepID=UPI000D0360F7|nr:hypothetical protein [Streptomyces geranii]